MLLGLSLPMTGLAREATVTSPDGHITVTINDNDGRMTYAVALDDQTFLLPSALGLTTDFADFTRGLKITGTRADRIDRTYDMRQTKQSHIRFEATQLVVDIENAKEQQLSIEFVVGNRDIALRYLIPRQKKDNPKTAVVHGEFTSFRLPVGTTTFLSPQSDAMVGWERTKPSYEEEYTPDAPLTAKSKYGHGFTFPCLFHLPEGWALISETGVSSQYCGSRSPTMTPRWATPSPTRWKARTTASARLSQPSPCPDRRPGEPSPWDRR